MGQGQELLRIGSVFLESFFKVGSILRIFKNQHFLKGEVRNFLRIGSVLRIFKNHFIKLVPS